MLSFSHRFLFIFSHLLITITAQSNSVGYFCTPNNTFTPNGTYQANLDSVISILTSNTNITYGFYNFSFGQIPDIVNTIALCRGDVDLNSCRNCVKYCAEYLTQMCPNQKEAYVWYDICMFRYSDRLIYHSWDTTVPGIFHLDRGNDSQPEQFDRAMWKLLDKVKPIAISGDSLRKFATGSGPGTNNSTIYVLVQCTPDLSAQQCSNCLAASGSEFGRCCAGRLGASIFKPSCTLRFDTTQFYSGTPQLSSPSPLSPLGKHKGIRRTTIIVVAAGVSAILVTGISIWICIFRRKRKQHMPKEKFTATEYDSREIRLATGGFSQKNKLGQGAYGAVYKGILKDGTSIAVKKLITDSTQDEEDFKNEVLLLGKLTHKNLVRLLGFSRDGTRILLIYEFVPNGTLDDFLYGKRSNFDWNTLYKIIEGLAEGLVYLHIGSQLQIIHRDLKPSNILLDENMNPKIADFGTARLLVLNSTHRSTQKFMGTCGYTAPEYFNLFQYSMKTDVYSFGIIVLEIVSGQRISAYSPDDNLISFAWRNWQAGTLSNLINGALRTDSSSINSIRRCIQIGLLCVQANAVERPTMKSVYEWLTNHSISLAEPNMPAFFVNTYNSQSLMLEEDDSTMSSHE